MPKLSFDFQNRKFLTDIFKWRPQSFNLCPFLMPMILFVAVTEMPSLCLAQSVEIDLSGTVVDTAGKGIGGAKISLMESDLSAIADPQGNFRIQGTLAGIINQKKLPGGFQLHYAAGRISLENPKGYPFRIEVLLASGQRLFLAEGGRGLKSLDQNSFDLDRLTGTGSGYFWLRILTDFEIATFRFIKTAGGHGVLYGGNFSVQGPTPRGLLKKQSPNGFDRMVLDVSASGFLNKRFAQDAPIKSGLSLVLLPVGSTLKERIQDFIGPSRSLRVAFLRKEKGSLHKFVLNYVDLAEMDKDTMPVHVFPDSRGPETSSFGAFAPSWSPDGRSIAYETGYENLTLPISRIYVQPLVGARWDGPLYPATNARWWTDGKDTSLIWCTSGGQAGWADTTTSTRRQKVSKDTLTGSVEILAKGSYNGGLSRDGRFLATAYPFGVMLDRVDKGIRYMHVYPGHPKAKDGSSTDSLQVCNASISQDSSHPSRMLFLDFGVTAEPTYANVVVPKIYAQHRMILIGDYTSDSPGRIVDFVDTPPTELALNKTWDDPEWTNQADFLVATTRDPNGDLSNPAEPQSTQPDIYLIKLSTKESLRILSGANQIVPVAWIGP